MTSWGAWIDISARSARCSPALEYPSTSTRSTEQSRCAQGLARSPATDCPSELVSDCAHPVVARVVLDLGQAECLEDRRHVVAEPAAQALLQSLPAPHKHLA